MAADAVVAISLSAAYLAGLAGGMHCFAMCGGLAGALGLRARMQSSGAAAAFANTGLYHLGRLGGYMAAGALCGVLGRSLQALLDLARIGHVLRVLSGVLLLLIALRLLIRWNGLLWVEYLGGKFWSRLQPVARGSAARQGPANALLLGFLWGWLPCGLVYSMLLFTATSGGPAQGAFIMLAFGLGTLPSMLGSSLLASQLQRWMSGRWPRIAAGVLLLVFGVWMMVVPMRGHG